MPCDHCWHDTGVMLLTDPPQIVERCCHCGEKHNRDQDLFKDGKIHGKFLGRWREQSQTMTIPESRSEGG